MIDVRFSESFDPRGLRPEVWGVMPIVETCAMLLGARQLIWSSGADKLHSDKSLHYAGCAVDADVPGWGVNDFAALADMVRERVPKGCYDVVGHATSFHLEYQPKRWWIENQAKHIASQLAGDNT